MIYKFVKQKDIFDEEHQINSANFSWQKIQVEN
jgi:hypothetical protein